MQWSWIGNARSFEHAIHHARTSAASGVYHPSHSSLLHNASAPNLQHCQPPYSPAYHAAYRHAPNSSAVHPATGSPCLCSAQGQVGPSDGGSRLHSLLQDRGVLLSSDAFQQTWQETPAWREQLCTEADVQAVEDGLLALLGLLGSGAVVARLLTAQPKLLTAPIESWLAFFEEYGFTTSQTKNLIAQFPEVLVQGSIADAGLAILHLKQLGFDDEAVRHKVVAFCPQVLMMSPAAIDNVVSIWSKFNAGVTERSC